MTSDINIENFNVSFDGFTPEAEEAFLFAIDIMDNILDPSFVSQPINLQVSFADPADFGLSGNILGKGSPSFILSDVSGFISDEDIIDIFVPNVVYPEALLNQFTGINLLSGPEITLIFNINNDNWFFGLDPNEIGNNEIDFVTVALHELIHGLGFADGFTINNGLASFELGAPTIYDIFLANDNGELILNTENINNPNDFFPNNGATVANELVSEELFFVGENALAANNGDPVRLFAPPIFQPGSSVSHLDEDTFNDTIEALETPSISTEEINREIGPITLGILEDIGWKFLVEETNIEEINPINNIDIDGNGEADALSDGLLIVRFLFGFTGDSLINGAISENATRNTAAEIEGFLQDANDNNLLDIDGNGEADALSDGLLIVRFLFGFTGDSLINGAIAENAQRNTASEIEAFLESLVDTTETIII